MFTKSSALKMTASIALISLTAILPFGCSKEKSAQPAAEQQAAVPGKEHFEKGVQFSLKGQHDEAIKEYELSLAENPKSAEAHNNIGFAYMDMKDYENAVVHQKQALELNPSLANAYYGLAMALEKKGDKADAVKYWKEFAKLSQPHSKWWMKAQEHIKALEKK